MPVRALRGATTVETNDRKEILEATEELLRAIVATNDLTPDQVISALFTATDDLNAVYPAEAARQLGWQQASLLCVQEMKVADSLPMCLRVLVHIESSRAQGEMEHCYLRGAQELRPDWAN